MGNIQIGAMSFRVHAPLQLAAWAFGFSMLPVPVHTGHVSLPGLVTGRAEAWVGAFATRYPSWSGFKGTEMKGKTFKLEE